MAKPNYQYEKRQKEIAKKSKQEEKRRQKLKDNAAEVDDGQTVSLLHSEAVQSSADGAPVAIPDSVGKTDGS